MKSEWTTRSISDIAEINPRESISKGSIAKKIPMDVLQPFTRDVPGYQMEKFKGGTRFRNMDTIMARITPCLENGKTAQVRCLDNGEVGFGSTEYIVFRAKEGTDPDYLYYLICSPLVRDPAIKSMVGSSGRQRVQTDVVANLQIAVPDFDEQKNIGGLLKALDDKIQLNTAINKNLEAQGLALYKSYFIDFDPYEGTRSKGWNVVSLEDVCLKITDGSHYSPKDDSGAPYPMYSVKDMETYGFNSSSCKHISADEFERMKKSDCVPLVNDILVAKDGSYLKEIFICSEQKDEAVLSSIAIFRPDPNVILPDILLFLLKQPSIRADVADNYVSGSALPRIVLKDFKKYQFILPPIDEQRKIGNILHSFRMQITSNVNENNRLNALRDALLPKLMSGEIDVSDIDF